MELFLEQEEYIAELTEGAGMRVTIHANDRMPFPEDDGLLVAPGSQTFMALRVVILSVLNSFYATNVHFSELVPFSIF